MNTSVEAIYEEIRSSAKQFERAAATPFRSLSSSENIRAPMPEVVEFLKAHRVHQNEYVLQDTVAASQANGGHGFQESEKEDLMGEFFVAPAMILQKHFHQPATEIVAPSAQQNNIFEQPAAHHAHFSIMMEQNVAPLYQNQHIYLKNSEDWEDFHRVLNEMMVLTNGRGLFPRLDYGFINLIPTDVYLVGLKMLLQSPTRYQCRRGQWEAGKDTKDINLESKEIFLELKTGEEAMRDGFGLEKTKIYNKRSGWKTGPVSAKAKAAETEKMLQVVPQHFYIPQLTLYHVCGDTMEAVDCAVYRETEFLVVTKYMGEAVKKMKLDNKYVRDDVRESVRGSISPPTSSGSIATSSSPQPTMF